MLSQVEQTQFLVPFWDPTVHIPWSPLFSKIKVYQESLRAYEAENSEDVREIQSFAFLIDVIHTEALRVETEDLDEFLFKVCSGEPMTPSTRGETKVYSLYQAFCYAMNLPKTVRFDEDLVKSIHMMVCGPLEYGPHATPGEYRTIHVEPVGSDFPNLYSHPSMISRRISALLSQVQSHLETYSSLQDRIRLSAWFLVEFLRIHPFVNGNGRTGRILMQILMKDQVLAPMGLCLSSSRSREYYLQALDRFDVYRAKHGASDMATYAAHTILSTLQRMDYLLGFHLNGC